MDRATNPSTLVAEQPPAITPAARLARDPAPLAGAYQQVLSAADGAARHQALLDLGAALVKYLTSAILAQYVARRADDPPLNRTLGGLRRPGLVGWVRCLAAGVEWWRRRGGAAADFAFPELLGRYHAPSPELPQTAALLSQARGRPQKTASLGELFEWLATSGAPAAGRSDDALLQAALEEVLDTTRSLAAQPLVLVDPLLVQMPCPVDGRIQPFFLDVDPAGRLHYRSYSCGHSISAPTAGRALGRLVRRASARARRRILLTAIAAAAVVAVVVGLFGHPEKFPNDAFAPAWSPDGQQIAFTSSRAGRLQIYLVHPDGSHLTRLTQDGANDSEPAWSPDGRRLAFVSDRTGTSEIFVMQADGSNPTRLIDRATWEPAWSPDGKRIAYRGYYGGQYDLGIMNADGSGEQPFLDLHDEDGQPAWAPDGQHIAFRAYAKHWDIFVMSPDGSHLVALTHEKQGDSDPAWSPDGRRIAFRSVRDLQSEIYVMNADGSGVTRLTNNPATDAQPAWSPDGRQIAFMTDRDGPLQIYLIHPDGSGLARLDTGPIAPDAPPTTHP